MTRFEMSGRDLVSPGGLYSAVRGCDLVLDIGAGDSFADIYGPARIRKMLLGKFIVHAARRPMILSPQTMGPFTRAWARQGALASIRRCRSVFTRDAISTSFLRDIGFTGTIGEATDVAMRLPYNPPAPRGGGSIRVGLNVSGLLMNGGYTGKNMFELTIDYPALIREILRRFAAMEGVETHLVGHVISESQPIEDDFRAGEALAREFPGVILAPRFESPSEAKSYIAGMDFFMGARMHACIAAFSSGVPVIPMAYSRKFAGTLRHAGLRPHRRLHGRDERGDPGEDLPGLRRPRRAEGRDGRGLNPRRSQARALRGRPARGARRARSAMTLMPTDLAKQFVLGLEPVDIPGGTRDALPSLHLARVAPLPLVRVSDAEGVPIGALLGTPIDLAARTVLAEKFTISEPLGDDVDGFVERNVFALAGSFIFILDVPGTRRVYLDACGSLSAVYDPGTRRVGATAFALLDADEADRRFRRDLYDQIEIRREGWFPGGLTAHEGISRLMPNFHLDLADFTVRRHWPRAPIPEDSDPEAMCGRIISACEIIIDTVARRRETFIALTAGNETRLLLAASRKIEGARFVTVEVTDPALDINVARHLARRFGLPHRTIPQAIASESEAADWQARSGMCVSGAGATSSKALQILGPEIQFVGGLGGEIGRGFFWRPGDDAHTLITAENICARFGMPPAPEMTEAIAAWLPSVEGFDSFLKLDLAYIELRMGPWAFATSYCNPHRRSVHPLIFRESFAAMLALPPSWRRMEHGSNRMLRTCIASRWPELLEVPIGRYGDWRDTLSLAWRAIRRPHLVAKKIRKRFA